MSSWFYIGALKGPPSSVERGLDIPPGFWLGMSNPRSTIERGSDIPHAGGVVIGSAGWMGWWVGAGGRTDDQKCTVLSKIIQYTQA